MDFNTGVQFYLLDFYLKIFRREGMGWLKKILFFKTELGQSLLLSLLFRPSEKKKGIKKNKFFKSKTVFPSLPSPNYPPASRLIPYFNGVPTGRVFPIGRVVLNSTIFKFPLKLFWEELSSFHLISPLYPHPTIKKDRNIQKGIQKGNK